MGAQDGQRRAHLVRGVGGEAAHALHTEFQALQHGVEAGHHAGQLDGNLAGRQGREVRTAGGPFVHLLPQADHGAQAPAHRRPDQQARDQHEGGLQRRQPAQHLARQLVAALQRLGHLHHDHAGDTRQAAGLRGQAYSGAAIGVVPEGRTADGRLVEGHGGQVGIAGDQLGVVPDAVVDIVALGVLQHPQRGGREVQCDLPLLDGQGLGDRPGRGAQQAVGGMLDDAVDQQGPAGPQQYGHDGERPDHHQQQPADEGRGLYGLRQPQSDTPARAASGSAARPAGASCEAWRHRARARWGPPRRRRRRPRRRAAPSRPPGWRGRAER